MFVIFSSVFEHILYSTSTFRQNAKDVDTGRPSGHFGRGLGAIRALWSAWQALKVFFPAGVDKSISRGFCMRSDLFSYVRTIFFCFEHSPEPRQQIAAPCRDMATSSWLPTYSPAAQQQQQEAPCACGRCALCYAINSCFCRSRYRIIKSDISYDIRYDISISAPSSSRRHNARVAGARCAMLLIVALSEPVSYHKKWYILWYTIWYKHIDIAKKNTIWYTYIRVQYFEVYIISISYHIIWYIEIYRYPITVYDMIYRL